MARTHALTHSLLEMLLLQDERLRFVSGMAKFDTDLYKISELVKTKTRAETVHHYFVTSVSVCACGKRRRGGRAHRA